MNFVPITWVGITHDTDHFLLVIGMFGEKKTKVNITETGRLSANCVSTDMLPLVDYFGFVSGLTQRKDALAYEYEEGLAVHVPVLCASRWVYGMRSIENCFDRRFFYIFLQYKKLTGCGRVGGLCACRSKHARSGHLFRRLLCDR